MHEEAALALGATRWEMIRTAVLPFGRPGMISAAMLGLGPRARRDHRAGADPLGRRSRSRSASCEPAATRIAANIANRFGEASDHRAGRADRLRPGAVRDHAGRQHGRPAIIDRRRSSRECRCQHDHSSAQSCIDRAGLAVEPARVGDRAPSLHGGAGVGYASVGRRRRFLLHLGPRGAGRGRGSEPRTLAALRRVHAVASALVTRTASTDRRDLDAAPRRRRRRYHAIIGTLEQVGIATLISVPLGCSPRSTSSSTAEGRRLARYDQLLRRRHDRHPVDRRRTVRPGVLGARAGPQLLRLRRRAGPVDPDAADRGPLDRGDAAAGADALREASYALGVPKWKTILRIVLPTALTGIVTGVMLAIARVAGETAPLLLTVFITDSINIEPVQRTAGVAPAVHLRPGTAAERHRR